MEQDPESQESLKSNYGENVLLYWFQPLLSSVSQTVDKALGELTDPTLVRDSGPDLSS